MSSTAVVGTSERPSVLPYALTIFLSAFLLFLVQPIIAKQILPWFGGSVGRVDHRAGVLPVDAARGLRLRGLDHPARRPARRRRCTSLLLAVSLLSLPILASTAWKPHGDEEPTLRILLLLTATIGLPYFLLSTTDAAAAVLVLAALPQRRAVPAVRAVELRIAARAARLPGPARAVVRPRRSSAGAGRRCTSSSSACARPPAGPRCAPRRPPKAIRCRRAPARRRPPRRRRCARS